MPIAPVEVDGIRGIRHKRWIARRDGCERSSAEALSDLPLRLTEPGSLTSGLLLKNFGIVANPKELAKFSDQLSVKLQR